MSDEKQPEMKEVRAKEMGFYNGSMVPAGKVFSVPVSFKASWVIDSSAPVAKKKKLKEPETLSELGKQSRMTNAQLQQLPKEGEVGDPEGGEK